MVILQSLLLDIRTLFNVWYSERTQSFGYWMFPSLGEKMGSIYSERPGPNTKYETRFCVDLDQGWLIVFTRGF